MKKTFKRNFPLLIAKDAAIFVGVVCWFVMFINVFSENYSIFSISNLMLQAGNMFGNSINNNAIIVNVVLFAIIAIVVLFSCLIIGLSFLRGRFRSISSIVSGVILFFFSIIVVVLLNYFGHNYFVSSGYGSYVFIVTTVAVVVISVFDLIFMKSSMDNVDDDFQYIDVSSESTTMISAQRGTIDCISGEYKDYNFPINEGEILVIGKNPATCSIVITQQAQYISSQHCSVRINNGRYEVFDQSKNGVRVNGNLIEKNRWYLLNMGDLFCLGDTDNVFRVS